MEIEISCEYCEKGKYFNLHNTIGFKNDRKYESWIMTDMNGKNPGIMITTDNSNGVYFDINYCPICGKNLKKENHYYIKENNMEIEIRRIYKN